MSKLLPDATREEWRVEILRGVNRDQSEYRLLALLDHIDETGWHPIETAPAGRTIILGRADGEVVFAKRSARDGCFYYPPEIFLVREQYTHWMETPSADALRPAAISHSAPNSSQTSSSPDRRDANE